MSNKKIVFVINHAAFFESHILPVANEAKKNIILNYFVECLLVQKWISLH